jgi:hypothetical protein
MTLKTGQVNEIQSLSMDNQLYHETHRLIKKDTIANARYQVNNPLHHMILS